MSLADFLVALTSSCSAAVIAVEVRDEEEDELATDPFDTVLEASSETTLQVDAGGIKALEVLTTSATPASCPSLSLMVMDNFP